MCSSDLGIAIWVAALIVFAECGLLLGFFLPGDSLLFVVGLFVGNGAIGVPLWETCLILVVAAFAGNILGYWIGRRAGPAIFTRHESRIFKRKYIDQTEIFFERYGAAAVILGRFIAIVRTFITVLAGAGSMDFRRFATYSAIGAFLWVVSMTVLGYLIGNVPAVKNNLDVAILVIVGALEFNALKGKTGPMTTVKGVITSGFVLAAVLYAVVEIMIRM